MSDVPAAQVHPLLRAFVSLSTLLSTLACDARYESLQPMHGADGGAVDASGVDEGVADGRADADVGTLIASGALEGRSGYGASGSVELRRLGDGSLALRFSDDFRAQGVPSPVALLTTRDVVTGGVQPALGDISLGPMSSVVGAQSYAAPEAGAGAQYAFVYCLPFTVEVARARLESAP